MKTRTFSVSEARAQLADLLEALAEGDQRIVIERYGKPVGVILHPEEVRVLDAIEDKMVQLEIDRRRAAGTLDDGGRIDGDALLRELLAEPVIERPRPAPPAAAVTARIAGGITLGLSGGTPLGTTAGGLTVSIGGRRRRRDRKERREARTGRRTRRSERRARR